jgi:hypothetical protein
MRGEEQDVVKYYTDIRASFVQNSSNPLKKIACYVMFDYSKWKNEAHFI